MLKFDLNVPDRRALVKRLEALVGSHPIYTRAPFYAFEVGNYIIDRDGNLFIDETLADVNILTTVMQEGLICGGEIIKDVEEDDSLDVITEDYTENKAVRENLDAHENKTEYVPKVIHVNMKDQEETSKNVNMPEDTGSESADDEGIPLDMDFPLPLDGHNGWTLRNLMNLFYSRFSLINKATGSHFLVSKELIDTLKDDSCTYTIANFRKALSQFAESHGEPGFDGIEITDSHIIFSGFAKAPDLEHLTAYGQLVVLMNQQALSQRRILAKVIDETNEKYAMRTWMIRLGMNGDDFKATRKILMENLNGITSCRTAEQAEAARERAFERRQMQNFS